MPDQIHRLAPSPRHFIPSSLLHLFPSSLFLDSPSAVHQPLFTAHCPLFTGDLNHVGHFTTPYPEQSRRVRRFIFFALSGDLSHKTSSSALADVPEWVFERRTLRRQQFGAALGNHHVILQPDAELAFDIHPRLVAERHAAPSRTQTCRCEPGTATRGRPCRCRGQRGA